MTMRPRHFKLEDLLFTDINIVGKFETLYDFTSYGRNIMNPSYLNLHFQLFPSKFFTMLHFLQRLSYAFWFTLVILQLELSKLTYLRLSNLPPPLSPATIPSTALLTSLYKDMIQCQHRTLRATLTT